MIFQDPAEKGIFFRNFVITLIGFILAIVVQIFFVLDQPDPHYIFIPLMVGVLVGSLFGYNGVLKRRLSRSNQAKSDFLSRMSHEFRTPLTSIIGFSQIVRNNPAVDEVSRGQVGRIHDAGQHLLGLVEDLLEFARIEAGRINLNIESVSSNTLIEECIRMIEPLADEQDIQIENRMPTLAPVMIQIDHMRGRQVIMNLLSNAVKYNREHGKIVISGQQTESGQLRITVADTGIGIASEHIPLVFDYFLRLESEHFTTTEGTGIGLAIAQQFVEMMGGKIGVESEVGEGSQFWLEWPVSPYN